MNKNHIIGILIIVIGYLLYLMFSGDKDLKLKVKNLEREKDSISVIIKSKDSTIVVLQDETYLEQELRRETERRLYRANKKRNEVSTIVSNLDELQLDEFLTNYRSVQRSKE